MNVTAEMIELISEYAALFLKISEIAILIGVDADELRELIEDRTTEVSIAYHRAKLLKTIELRKQEIELAELGNGRSLDLVRNYITEQTLDE